MFIGKAPFPGHEQGAETSKDPKQQIIPRYTINNSDENMIADALGQCGGVFASVSNGPKCELRENAGSPKQETGDEIWQRKGGTKKGEVFEEPGPGNGRKFCAVAGRAQRRFSRRDGDVAP